MQSVFKKIPPSILLIGLIVLITAVLIAVSSAGIYIEGVMSLILLGAGAIVFWTKGKDLGLQSGLSVAFAISIFAIFGIIFDGAGNFIYNKPLELIFCPAKTHLTREVKSYETEDGEMYTHHFSCTENAQGQTVKTISIYVSTALRFVEYVFLGCILVGVNGIFRRLAKRKNQT